MAVIAEAIRRSVGFTVDDMHIGIALMMFDQINRHRPRRATKGISSLNRILPTRRDRSLAAAFPTLYYGGMAEVPVTVLVTTAAYARHDAELYRTILDQLGAAVSIEALEDERQARATFDTGRAMITVATPQTLYAAQGHSSMVISRLDSDSTKRLVKAFPQVATLPDL